MTLLSTDSQIWKQAIEGEERTEGQYKGSEGEKGFYGIIWNLVCETSENCKALQNLENILLNFFKKEKNHQKSKNSIQILAEHNKLKEQKFQQPH